MCNENKLIPFPQYDVLKEEIQTLRDEISAAILEQDNLQLQQCKNIEAAYLLRFGALEYAVYEAECQCLRLKRKLELVIAKRNRQEKVDLKALERTLDREFRSYQAQLEEMIQNMNAAMDRSRAKKLSDTDAAAMKAMYRKIVKALHPDLHPELSEAKAGLFVRAVAAYEEGNLEMIQATYDMIGRDDLHEAEGSLLDYRKEKEQLIKKLEQIRARTAEIQTTYPYVLREFLDDETRAIQKTEELERLREMYLAQAEEYKMRINEYLS